MESPQISLRDLSFSSTALFMLGLATVLYLARLRSKSASTWWLMAAFVCFTLAAIAMFVVSSVALWGYALWPTQYTFALLGMLLLIQFAYRFPQNDQPLKARRWLMLSGAVILLAFGFCAYFAYQVLVNHVFMTRLDDAFLFLLPLGTLAALVVFMGRVAHCAIPRPAIRADIVSLSAIVHTGESISRPQSRHARTLRNLAVGLLFSLLTGLSFPLAHAGLIAPRTATFLMGTGALLGLATLILAYLDYGAEPTSFIVKLVGVSLVINLIIFGLVGLYAISTLDRDYGREKELEVLMVEKGLRAEDLSNMPDSVAYIAACPSTCAQSCFACGVQSVYVSPPLPDGRGSDSRGADRGLQFLVTEDRLGQSDPDALIPFRNCDSAELPGQLSRSADQIVMRYADNALGTLHEYIGYRLSVDSIQYEVGFRLSEYRRYVHDAILTLIYMVLGSSAIVLIVFPLFLRTNLIRPLQALLEGVRQVNAGNLDVAVPMQMGDEIGFLAYSFTGMVGSIRTLNASLWQEIGERQRAEAEVKALNATLEQRVAEQTRGLSALYNVSAAASQALTLEALMACSLEQTMAAVSSTAGLVYLADEVMGRPDSPWLQLVAHRGIPSRMVARIARMPADQGLTGWVVQHKEPLLVPDLSQDARTPPAVWARFVRSGILSPLRAGGQVVGVFGLLRRREEAFNQEEVSLLASIADQIGLAVQGYQLRQMAEQTAVLKERHRLARDLHDSLTQYLYSLNMLAEAGQAQMETGALAAIGHTFGQIGRTARQALKEMRLFIQQLRPPALEQVGLVGALHQRLAAVEGRANVQTRLLVDEAIVLPVRVEEALYHIALEALNNTLRHADADTVSIYLRLEGDQAVLEMVDNGRGFDLQGVDRNGLGLTSMRERASQVGGDLQIISSSGTGTVIRVTVPIVP